LTPDTFDKVGMLFNKDTLKLKSWEMFIDLSIDSTKKNSMSKGGLNIYFLRESPKRSGSEFAKGLNSLFSGLRIEIRENNKKT
jgi:hypothetical protein